MNDRTFFMSCLNLTRASRNLLWTYSPEMLVILGFLAGMIVMGLMMRAVMG